MAVVQPASNSYGDIVLVDRTQFAGVTIRSIMGILLAIAVVGCHDIQIDTGRTPLEVQGRIRAYYISKYPTFAEFDALPGNLSNLESIMRSTELHKICPVDECINSSPYGPFCTFVERTEKSRTEVSVTKVDLYADGAKPCRVRVRVDIEEKRKDVGYSTLHPITEDEIRVLVGSE